jgi:hypothetical protein
MNEPWFRQRRYGYGSSPSTWQGWATIIAFPIILIVVALVIFGEFPVPDGQALGRIVGFLVFVAVALYVFLTFVRAKTTGEWRWRWGDDQ